MSSPQSRPREGPANIFINYRREDSAGHAGRLSDGLSRHFAGRLFMDVDTLEPGVDFVEAIEQAVGACEVLIVVIGREWLTCTDKAGHRRLDNPDDFVRLEVESALARNIRVIPVLVQDTPMPRADELPPSLAKLARRNAIELSDARWSYDVDRLAETIEEVLEDTGAAAPAPGPRRVAPPQLAAPAAPAATATKPRAWMYALAAVVLVAAVGLASALWLRRAPNGNQGSPPVQQGTLGGSVGVPAVGAGLGNPPSVQPATNPANSTPPAGSSGPVLNTVNPEPHGVEVTTRVKDGPANSPAADSRPAASSTSVPAAQQPQVTITFPRNGEKVGPKIQVEGFAFGLGDQRVFLCIKHPNGVLYPRGEVFVKDNGKWGISLNSSKEKTFGILLVTSASTEADQALRAQESRDDGLSGGLPTGATISSDIVEVKRQGKIRGLISPKDPNGR